MKTSTPFFILLVLAAVFSCNTKIESGLEFVYFVDRKGVFLFSLAHHTSKLIYPTGKIFINGSLRFLNDSTLQLGHQGEMRSVKKLRKVNSKYFYRADGDSTFVTDNPPYWLEDNYDYLTDSIYNLNIRTRQAVLATTIGYEHYEHRTLTVSTKNFDRAGHLTSQSDTSFACNGYSRSAKGISFGNSKRYYAESDAACGRKIVTDHGNVILIEKGLQKVLLKYEGNFDPKFGSGYYNPTLSSDGKRTSFQYMPGFLKSGNCIYEMDIDTKKVRTLITGSFSSPQYSPDGRLLLLSANSRKAKGNTWISDIHVMDIATKTIKKITEGDSYLWIPRKQTL